MILPRPVPRRHRHLAATLLASALALASALIAGAVPGLPAPAAAAASSGTPWPASPDWQGYVEAPSGSTVCPAAISSTTGTVTGASNLVCGGSGRATLTMTSGGTSPSIVLDYGHETGGIPFFNVSSESGSPTLTAAYSEGLNYLSATNGDGSTPWGEGDSSRADSYTVTGAGTITNKYVQGGERYEEISLTSAGTLTLSGAGITYIADRSSYQGYFVSSSDELNKIWYDSAYTAQIDSVPADSLPGNWTISGGVLDAAGGNVGLLSQGSSWPATPTRSRPISSATRRPGSCGARTPVTATCSSSTRATTPRTRRTRSRNWT